MAKTPHLGLRVDPETKRRWEKQAAERGLTLSDFIRTSVDQGFVEQRGCSWWRKIRGR